MLNLTEYAGLLIYVIIGLAFIGGVFFLSALFRERSDDPRRKIVYECGMEPIGSAYVSPNIRFYIFALLFVIFDVEAAFLIPWALQVRELGWVGFGALSIFILVLFVPFVYAWRRNALTWE